jgi:amino acid permease
MYYLSYVFNYVILDIYNFPTPQHGHNPNNYGRALMSAPPQAITSNPHTNLLNVYIQIANKMRFQKKKTVTSISSIQLVVVVVVVVVVAAAAAALIGSMELYNNINNNNNNNNNNN